MKREFTPRAFGFKYVFVILFLLPFGYASVAQDNFRILTDSREQYSGVTLANGRIGLVAGCSLFSVSDIVLNGVYDKEYIGGVSRIVRAPEFTHLRLSVDGVALSDSNITGWRQCFDMKEARLTTSFEYEGTQVDYTLYALRNLPYMSLVEVSIMPSRDIELGVLNSVQFAEELKSTRSYFMVLRDAEAHFPLNISQAQSRTQLNDLASCGAFIFEGERPEIAGDERGMSFSTTLKAGQRYRFALVGSVGSSRDFFDVRAEVERMTIFAMCQSIDYLVEGHKREWAELWRGDIIIEGCDSDQLDVRMALYNLYSFQRAGSRLSVAPMGLSTTTGYNGHIFWDSEIWMYPPMLLLNSGIAKSHIDYRTDRLGKAIQRASMFGYRGAMYPWESDDSGEEATPTWCLTGTFEHHISADIAIAFWNYYRVTKNLKWLKSEGYNVIREIADFWVSRSTRNSDGSYSILNVVGANEYAPNVDDNAFTNGAAKTALLNAVLAAKEVGETPNSRWLEVSKGLKILKMDDGTTKENATYNGEMIKQADVNLLAYPLEVISDTEQIKKDLFYYEDKIDKVNGPAMGSSILSVLHSRLGDREKAYELFKKSYIPNKRAPFGVLSETPNSNNPYFATGAGGMLQAVLFGFGGLKITDKGVVQDRPLLPLQWKSLTITGVGVDRKTITIK